MSDYNIDSCCNSGYFLGSSRTYVFLATTFTGVNRPLISPAFYNVADTRCMSSLSYIYGPRLGKNFIDISSDRIQNDELELSAGGQDKFEVQYKQVFMSEYISHNGSLGGNNLIAYRDKGILVGGGFLSIAALMSCNQMCWRCQYVNGQNCGRPENMMNRLGDAMDAHWYENEKFIPWDGFILDWYGLVERKAEPVSGWASGYFFPYLCPPCGTYDEYCECCYFCALKNCIEPHFIAKIYGGSVLTLNLKRGVPFLRKEKLLDFYNITSYNYKFGESNIKLDHLADEYIFVAGAASWSHGDIYFDKLYRPGSEFAIDVENDIEASIVTGNGTGPNDIKILLNYPVQINRTGGNQGFLVKNQAVKYKNEIYNSGDVYRSELNAYPWIRVDIPEPLQIEKSYISFSYDSSTLPDIVYGGGIAFNPSSFSWNYGVQRKLFARSRQLAGGILGYNYISARPDPDDPLVFYYKRYIKKIIKAPNFLYLKENDQTFRSCKLGETLKNLEPGRYYFPNPIFTNRQLRPFDPDLEDLRNLDMVDTTEDFSKYFNTNFRLFNLENRTYLDVDELRRDLIDNNNNYRKKYENAIGLIGAPSISGSFTMEYGGSFNFYGDQGSTEEYIKTFKQQEEYAQNLERFFQIPR